MVRNDIKNSSLLKTKFLIYAFNGRTQKSPPHATLERELGWDNDKFLDGIYNAYRRS